MARAVQDDNAYALAKVIVQRFDEVSLQIKTAGPETQGLLDRNTSHV